MSEEALVIPITSPPGPALAKLGLLGSAMGTALDRMQSLGEGVGWVGGGVGGGWGGWGVDRYRWFLGECHQL
jgi:hypothetical protein